VSQARCFLASLLVGSPAVSDALVCLSELATNAIQHSNSRRPGGTFTVRVSLHPGCLRVEVEDEGGPWLPRHHGDRQGGRGLQIVSALATGWHISGDGTTGHAVCFHINLP